MSLSQGGNPLGNGVGGRRPQERHEDEMKDAGLVIDGIEISMNMS